MAACQRCNLTVAKPATEFEHQLAKELPLSFYCWACVRERNANAAVKRHAVDTCACCVYIDALSDHRLPINDTHTCIKCKSEVCGNCLEDFDTAKAGQCLRCAHPRIAKRMQLEAPHERRLQELCEANAAPRRTAELATCQALRAAQGIAVDCSHLPHGKY